MRRLPEFKFWYSATKGIVISLSVLTIVHAKMYSLEMFQLSDILRNLQHSRLLADSRHVLLCALLPHNEETNQGLRTLIDLCKFMQTMRSST